MMMECAQRDNIDIADVVYDDDNDDDDDKPLFTLSIITNNWIQYMKKSVCKKKMLFIRHRHQQTHLYFLCAFFSLKGIRFKSKY